MTLTLATSLVLALSLAMAAIFLIRKMGPSGHSLPVTAEWIDDLSIEQYKPMLRLLDSADIEFLRSQPGYTRAMEVKLRAQRCQELRGYLRDLNTDFQGIVPRGREQPGENLRHHAHRTPPHGPVRSLCLRLTKYTASEVQ
jgi:hypothetical protein